MTATVSQYGWATAEGWERYRETITDLYFYQVSIRSAVNPSEPVPEARDLTSHLFIGSGLFKHIQHPVTPRRPLGKRLLTSDAM